MDGDNLKLDDNQHANENNLAFWTLGDNLLMNLELYLEAFDIPLLVPFHNFI